jgi:hypothetical protein
MEKKSHSHEQKDSEKVNRKAFRIAGAPVAVLAEVNIGPEVNNWELAAFEIRHVTRSGV